MRHAMAVGTVRGHGVIGVGDVNDTRIDRSLSFALAMWVACSVPVLVMQLNCGQIFCETVHTFEDPAADHGVLLYLVEFFLGETTRLLKNTVGDSDLAYVVK